MIKLKTNKQKLITPNYDKISHLEFVEPKKDKKTKILCIILHESGSSKWLWKKRNVSRFSYNDCTYYIISKGLYKADNGTNILVYLEGISTPISHDNIDKEIKTVVIENPATQKQETHKVALIKGLKFDGKLIDLLLNRDLFKEFTKTYLDVGTTFTVIILAIVLVIGIINIALQIML